MLFDKPFEAQSDNQQGLTLTSKGAAELCEGIFMLICNLSIYIYFFGFNVCLTILYL